MKKSSIILSASLLIIAISGCNKFLDVTPKFVFPEETALKTIDGAQTTTIGAFNLIQGGNIYGGGIIANSELLADFITTDPISDFGLNQLRSHQLNAYNPQAGGLWGDAYHAIHTVNLIMKHLPDYGTSDISRVNKIKGQCLFIRGAMHFELVRMFAQPSGYTGDDSHLGIPIRLTPGSATDGGSEPRSSVAQVYAQIIADLQQAEQLLPPTAIYVGDSLIFAPQSAVQAMLIRVYFSQNKYTEAKSYADKLMNSGSFKLDQGDVSQIYRLTGVVHDQESIFQIINDANDNSNALNGQFSVPPFGSTVPTFRMSKSYSAYLSNDSDQRVKKLYKKSFGKYLCKKYDAPIANIQIIRYAEVLLTHAECLAQLGGSDALVRADVNLIRARAGIPQDHSTTGQAALLNLVRGERDFELGMEGDRFFELKRRRGTFHTAVGDFAWNDPTMIYPIPQQEVDQNKNMVQNPGY